jgi:hypothetical protein
MKLKQVDKCCGCFSLQCGGYFFGKLNFKFGFVNLLETFLAILRIIAGSLVLIGFTVLLFASYSTILSTKADTNNAMINVEKQIEENGLQLKSKDEFENK